MSGHEATHSALMTPPQASRIKQRMPEQSPFTSFIKNLPDLNPTTSSTYNSYSSFAFTVQSPTAPRFASSQGAARSRGGDQEQEAGAFTNILALADLKATPVKADAEQDGLSYRGGETPYGLRSPIPLFHESPRRPNPNFSSPGPGSKLSAPGTHELRERPSFGSLLGSPNVLTSSFAALLDGHSRSSPGGLRPSLLGMGGGGGTVPPSSRSFSPLFSPEKSPLQSRSVLGEGGVDAPGAPSRRSSREEGDGDQEGSADVAAAATEPAASSADAGRPETDAPASELGNPGQGDRKGTLERGEMPPPPPHQAVLFSPQTGSVGGPANQLGSRSGLWSMPPTESQDGARGAGSGSDTEDEEEDEEFRAGGGKAFPGRGYHTSWRRAGDVESPRVVKRRPSTMPQAPRSSRRLRDPHSLHMRQKQHQQQNGSSDDSHLPKEYETDDEVEPTPLVHAMLPQSPMCVPLNLETFLPIAKLRSDDSLRGDSAGSPTHRRGIAKPSSIDSPAVKAATNAAITAALEAAVGPSSSGGGVSGGAGRAARSAAEGGRGSVRAAAAAAAAAPLTRRMSSNSSARAAPSSVGPAGPPLSDEALMARMLSQSNKKCNCKKSKCLKLYCDCFAGGGFCGPQCSCVGCSNRSDNLEVVKQAREQIASRNPNAFKEKIEADSSVGGQHRRGCNCKKSHCMKKYCECFSAGVPCGEHCKCEGCHNTQENFKRQPPGRGRRPQAATAANGAAAASQPVSAATAAAMRAGGIPMMLIPAGANGARGLAVPASVAARGGTGSNRGMPTDAAAALALGGALQFLFPMAQQQQGGTGGRGPPHPPSSTPAAAAPAHDADAVTPRASNQPKGDGAAADSSERYTTPSPSLHSTAAVSAALGGASPQLLQMFSMLQAQAQGAAGSKAPGVVTSNGQVFLPVMWPFGGKHSGKAGGASTPMVPFNLPPEVQGDPAAAMKLLQQFAAQHMQQGGFPPGGMPPLPAQQQQSAQGSAAPPSPISSLAASLAPPALPLFPATAAIAAGTAPLHAGLAASAGGGLGVAAQASAASGPGIPENLGNPVGGTRQDPLPSVCAPADLQGAAGGGLPAGDPHRGEQEAGGAAAQPALPPTFPPGFPNPAPPRAGETVVPGSAHSGASRKGSLVHAAPAELAGCGVPRDLAAVSDMDLMLDSSSLMDTQSPAGSDDGEPSQQAAPPPPTWLQLNAIGGPLQGEVRPVEAAEQLPPLQPAGLTEPTGTVREPLGERATDGSLAGGMSTRKRMRDLSPTVDLQLQDPEPARQGEGMATRPQKQALPSPRSLSAMRKPQRTITSALH